MPAPIVYSGCLLDRASQRRGDAVWLGQRRSDPGSRVVAVWRDGNLFSPGDRPRLAALSGEAGIAALGLAEEYVLLGVDGGGRAWFACDLSGQEEASLAPLTGGGSFRDLGKVAPLLDLPESAILAYARAVLHWHRRHRFCGACGSQTRPEHAGHLRVCVAASCGLQQFPRTDPVVIMLVTRAKTKAGPATCLLGRQKQWMPGLVSALAGFVEPGETLEEAVRREVREETGLEVDAVRYWTSQPWPFPASLMLGFHARARSGELRLDSDELEDARWFRRDEVEAIRSLGLRLPFRGTLARALIGAWLAEDDAAWW